jgi:hypothetical protein
MQAGSSRHALMRSPAPARAACRPAKRPCRRFVIRAAAQEGGNQQEFGLVGVRRGAPRGTHPAPASGPALPRAATSNRATRPVAPELTRIASHRIAGGDQPPSTVNSHPPPLQAPAKLKTPYGEMLQYYLRMEPQLVKAAVESQLSQLQEEREAKEAAQRQAREQQERDSIELSLYARMEEVRGCAARQPAGPAAAARGDASGGAARPHACAHRRQCVLNPGAGGQRSRPSGSPLPPPPHPLPPFRPQEQAAAAACSSRRPPPPPPNAAPPPRAGARRRGARHAGGPHVRVHPGEVPAAGRGHAAAHGRCAARGVWRGWLAGWLAGAAGWRCRLPQGDLARSSS